MASGRPRVTMGLSTGGGVAGVGVAGLNIGEGRTTGRQVSAFTD